MNHASRLTTIIGFVSSACFLLTVLLTGLASGDLVLTTVGVAVTENYNDYQGDGFAPVPSSGQLNSNTYRATGFSDNPNAIFGGTYTTGDFARGTSTGGVITGGAYAFQLGATDYALGVQPTAADFTPGSLTIRLTNQTGISISGFRIAADALFFNDQDRSTRWSFAVSLDDSVYVDLFHLDSPQDADSMPAWATIPIAATVPFPGSLANGSQFYIRITGADLTGTGSRDEFAIDNLSITAVPEPAAVAPLLLLVGSVMTRRFRRRPAAW